MQPEGEAPPWLTRIVNWLESKFEPWRIDGHPAYTTDVAVLEFWNEKLTHFLWARNKVSQEVHTDKDLAKRRGTQRFDDVYQNYNPEDAEGAW